MNLPFGVDAFFEVFRQYNADVWPTQWLLNGLALSMVMGLLVPGAARPTWVDRWIFGVLGALWWWIALVYHWGHFSTIAVVAYGFAVLSALGGVVFWWTGAFRGRAALGQVGRGRKWLGGLLIVYALVVYPLWSTVSGHPYPDLPTFGLPCPTTIFTIGVLAFATGSGVRTLLVVPILWSLVGGQAAFLLDVKPDIGLAVAGVAGIWLFWRPDWSVTSADIA